ncbi:MAG: hypothetical protein IJ134_03215 [Bacilli bacterium]|nr:hypothetical protein [Bacilli bacterium]
MKKILNKKTIFAFILGLSLSSIAVYGANYLYASSETSYDNTNSGMESTNVQDALDELYQCAVDKGLVNQVDPYSMDAMCPGCVFAQNDQNYKQYIGEELAIETTNSYSGYSDGEPFLGYILNGTTIERAFACGIENGEAFCLEGYDTSKYSNNVDILNHFFPSCNANSISSESFCDGSSVSQAGADNSGYVTVDMSSHCNVSLEGNEAYCW